MALLFEKQILRDEEGKKLGLKASGKGSSSKDNEVKMSEAEVTNYATRLAKPHTVHTQHFKVHM